MSTINIRSRCHDTYREDWPTHDPLVYRLGDELHVISHEEVEAIERSGRSSFQHYRDTPTVWPQDTVPFIPLAEKRPGATVPGKSPLDFAPVQWISRGMTDVEKQFVTKFRKNCTIQMLSYVIGLNPAVITAYCRSVRMGGMPINRPMIRMEKLRYEWSRVSLV